MTATFKNGFVVWNGARNVFSNGFLALSKKELPTLKIVVVTEKLFLTHFLSGATYACAVFMQHSAHSFQSARISFCKAEVVIWTHVDYILHYLSSEPTAKGEKTYFNI